MSYLTLLERLPLPESLIANRIARRVVLLTGQSSFRSSRLSEQQTEFLYSIAPRGFEVIDAGWPYNRRLLDEQHHDIEMISAAIRNTRQVAWSLTSRRYRDIVRRSLRLLIRNTTDRLILITGSCGLQLANCGWPDSEGLKIDLIALGPVCLGSLNLRGARVRVLQGRADIWSRALYRGLVTASCDCAHLEYWTNDAARQTVREWLADAH